ncbi:MAG: N4-gp56 family major capsid protein [Firmicutes bacterium]|nr:N4-gp56 family major capsid protein [Bacillota bacterium]
MDITKMSDMVNPKVMADMISGKIEKKIVVAPFAKVDDSLVGVAGDTIVVPQYSYIGDAADVAEGVAVYTSKLVTTTTEATIKKAMKAVEISDEALLSGYGNPIGETNNQLAMAIAAKVDNDAMDALLTAPLSYCAGGKISYDGIIDAIDNFGEETNCQKVMFIHPKQLTQLRHDADFISSEKYSGNVIITGEVGMIANTRIVPSKKVPLNSEAFYELLKTEPADWLSEYKTYFTKSGETYNAVTGNSAPEFASDTYYKKYEAESVYICPIVKIAQDGETEDETPALTIYLKRDTNVEAERLTLRRVTDISVDKFYTVVLSNEGKVVLAKFAKE